MDISVSELVGEIKTAVRGILKTDIESVRGFLRGSCMQLLSSPHWLLLQ